MKLKGEAVKQARQAKAWTQEQLSEESGLGLRTVRRLEAGQGSLDSLRRVSEVLQKEPAEFMVCGSEQVPMKGFEDWYPCSMVTLEMSTSLLQHGPQDFIEQVMARIAKVRKYLALETGFPLPGVRLHDRLSDRPGYRILLREVSRGEGELPLGRLMVVARREGSLEGLAGENGKDPTYGLPVKWIAPEDKAQAEAQGNMIFDHLSVMMTHLTQTLRRQAYTILGVEEVSFLLKALKQPTLVAEVVGKKIEIGQLRTVLRELLVEEVPIRDLSLILETILDQNCTDTESLLRACRLALKDVLVKPYATSDKKIQAIRLGSDELCPDRIEELCLKMEAQGLQALLITEPIDRSKVRRMVNPRRRIVLASDEIPQDYSVEELL